MKHPLLLIFILFIQVNLIGQAIYEEERYVPETNPLVNKKLKEWQGLKFGLLMHWGTYSQWGIVESWSLCPEEYGWCERKKGSNPDNYFEYKKEYENLISTFNPVKFDPDKWAEAAKNAGMKYVVFTTKHHDGFCMFDSKYTDYKVTGEDCPFSENPKSNISKEIFDAFRAKGLWAGAYFSKPDWHVPSYWDPKYPPKDRNVNYDPEDNPVLWNEFVEFTHKQMLELLTDYGKIDILWLDGGWVEKMSKPDIAAWYERSLKNDEKDYLKRRKINQDIRIDEFVQKARSIQPELIVVDRAVHGINQNYLTPENRVPDKTLPYPWESCVISGGGWSYTPDAKYMSGREGVQLLVDIVAKGGNLLLNIAPSPEGEWQAGAYELLGEYAGWMKVNKEAIYDTRPLPPYKTDNICMAQKGDDTQYYYYLCAENEEVMPREVVIKTRLPKAGSTISMLGYKEKLDWEIQDEGLVIKVPEALRKSPPCKYVWTFKVKTEE